MLRPPRLARQKTSTLVLWRRAGAAFKAAAAARLLRRNSVVADSILELGCGTGAVLEELYRRGLGREFVGVDASAEALAQIDKTALPALETHRADIATWQPTKSSHFDVVLLCHVLEHLEQPRRTLDNLRKIDFRFAIIEVPLEDLPVSRLKNLFRDRLQNSAGHVQFFHHHSFRRLLRTEGFSIMDELRYSPALSDEALRLSGHSEPTFLKKVTCRYSPALLEPLWKRFYYGHHAALCTLNEH